MPTTNYASSSKLSSSRAAKNDKNPKDDGNGDDDDLGDNDSGSNALAPRENVSANPSNDLTPGSTSTVPVQSSSTQSPIVVMPSTLVAESDFISPGYTYTIPASIYTLSQNPVVATSSEISQSTPPSVLTSIGTAPTSISTANPNNHTLSLSSKLESSKLTTADKICIAAISVGGALLMMIVICLLVSRRRSDRRVACCFCFRRCQNDALRNCPPAKAVPPTSQSPDWNYTATFASIPKPTQARLPTGSGTVKSKPLIRESFMERKGLRERAMLADHERDFTPVPESQFGRLAPFATMPKNQSTVSARTKSSEALAAANAKNWRTLYATANFHSISRFSGTMTVSPKSASFSQKSRRQTRASTISSVAGTDVSSTSLPRFRTVSSWVNNQSSRMEYQVDENNRRGDLPLPSEQSRQITVPIKKAYSHISTNHTLPPRQYPKNHRRNKTASTATVFRHHPGEKVQVAVKSWAPSDELNAQITWYRL